MGEKKDFVIIKRPKSVEDASSIKSDIKKLEKDLIKDDRRIAKYKQDFLSELKKYDRDEIPLKGEKIYRSFWSKIKYLFTGKW